MEKPNKNILVPVWRLIKGPLQWKALWLAHSKYIVGVSSIVLNDQQEVLLLQHSFWPEGSWGLPSGYANKGEKFEDTIKREVYEETKYKIEVDKLVNLISGYQLRVEVIYLSHLTGGSLQLDPSEVLSADFFPLSKLPEGLLGSHKEYIMQAAKLMD